ncbi:MAG TPA: hypothetical protein VFQ41_18560 [Candidatus Angelobacter sp.]|nr:hypothetical protein [Candidatus Angelobacter sp.]
MRRLEVSSDKTTVLGVLFGLAMALVAFLADVHDLVWHRTARLQVGAWTYPAALVIVWIAVSFCRDSKIRKAYPYGVAGGCLAAVSFLIMIGFSWLRVSNKTQNLRHSMLMVLEVVGYGLVLFEGVRWFRSIVKLAEKRAK